MRCLLLLLIIALCQVTGASQDGRKLVAAGGGNVVSGAYQVTFSIGEPVTGTRMGGRSDVTTFALQGFQQPDQSAGALPVEWRSFTARPAGKRNQLDWVVVLTGEEDAFIVERSLNGVGFDPIDTLYQTQTLMADNAYRWFDEDFPPSLIFYHIRQTDRDGSTTVSGIEAIDRRGKPNVRFVVYPNPAGERLWVEATDRQASTLYDFALYDALGHRVRKRENLSETTAISLAGLPPGTYAYTITSGTHRERGILIHK